MSAPVPTPNHRAAKDRDALVVGIVLIAVGLVVFVGQVVDLPDLKLLILPALAAIFLIAGLLTREIGLVIPGGILAGIALGIGLIAGPSAPVLDVDQGGVFLVAFSVGWALITLLSPFTRQGFQWWPLIPGGIIGLVGLAVVQGGAALSALEIIGYLWPLVLIGVGIVVLLRRRA
ncbi:MAG: hypothetical protein NZ528_11890 [Caldilineales bacterium]|nr:hypothetical protein [Caldilineales bacterium]MDW8317578.1 hypothetical protein [Anaerolineae bacterium]